MDTKQIEALESLGKIRLTEIGRAEMEKDLENITAYFKSLDELNTDNIEPLSHAFPVNNVLREDVVLSGFSREAILKNAPNRTEEYFKTFRVNGVD